MICVRVPDLPVDPPEPGRIEAYEEAHWRLSHTARQVRHAQEVVEQIGNASLIADLSRLLDAFDDTLNAIGCALDDERNQGRDI